VVPALVVQVQVPVAQVRVAQLALAPGAAGIHQQPPRAKPAAALAQRTPVPR